MTFLQSEYVCGDLCIVVWPFIQNFAEHKRSYFAVFMWQLQVTSVFHRCRSWGLSCRNPNGVNKTDRYFCVWLHDLRQTLRRTRRPFHPPKSCRRFQEFRRDRVLLPFFILTTFLELLQWSGTKYNLRRLSCYFATTAWLCQDRLLGSFGDERPPEAANTRRSRGCTGAILDHEGHRSCADVVTEVASISSRHPW